MTTKTLTEKVLSVAKPLAVTTLIAVVGTYAASCTVGRKVVSSTAAVAYCANHEADNFTACYERMTGNAYRDTKSK